MTSKSQSNISRMPNSLWQKIKTASPFLYLFQATFRRVILAEKTSLSSQYFYDLQKFVVIERGLVLLPVASPVEAGKILAQMVKYCFLSNEPPEVYKQFQSLREFGITKSYTATGLSLTFSAGGQLVFTGSQNKTI